MRFQQNNTWGSFQILYFYITKRSLSIHRTGNKKTRINFVVSKKKINFFHHLLFFLDIDYCLGKNMKKQTLSWCFFISREHLPFKKKLEKGLKEAKQEEMRIFFCRECFFCSHLIQFKTRVAKYSGCHEKVSRYEEIRAVDQ